MTDETEHCDGCHNLGGNWDCGGEGDEHCDCMGCSGDDECPECGR